MKDYPASKDREAALFNAARLLEGQQQYDEAAAAYLRYADLFPKAEDAPKNQYRAALIYEKQGDTKNEIKALKSSSASSAASPAQSELVVDAQKQLGDAYAKSGNPKDARQGLGDRGPGVRPARAQARAGAGRRRRRRPGPLPARRAGAQGVRQAEDRRQGQGAGAELRRQAGGGEEGAGRLRRGLQVQAAGVDAGRALPPRLRAGALRGHHHRDAGAARGEAARRRGGGRLPGPARAADRGARGQGGGELRRHPGRGEEEPASATSGRRRRWSRSTASGPRSTRSSRSPSPPSPPTSPGPTGW